MSRIDNEQSEKIVKKIDKKKILFIIKMILFIVMIGLTFILSDKIANIILATSLEMLTRIINIVFVVIVVAIFFKK